MNNILFNFVSKTFHPFKYAALRSFLFLPLNSDEFIMIRCWHFVWSHISYYEYVIFYRDFLFLYVFDEIIRHNNYVVRRNSKFTYYSTMPFSTMKLFYPVTHNKAYIHKKVNKPLWCNDALTIETYIYHHPSDTINGHKTEIFVQKEFISVYNSFHPSLYQRKIHIIFENLSRLSNQCSFC